MTAQEYLNRGEEHFNKNDFDRAIADFTEALRLEPNLTLAKSHLHTVYYNRGIANYQNGNNDMAIADLSEAVKFNSNPDDATVYGARGMIYDEIGNHDGVINDFTEVIRIAPSDNAYIFRGGAYYGKCKECRAAGDKSKFFEYIDMAIKDYEAALQIAPANETYRKMLELLISERENRKKVYSA